MSSGSPITTLSVSQPTSPKLNPSEIPRLLKEDPKDSKDLDLSLNTMMHPNINLKQPKVKPIPRNSKRSNSTSNDLLYERDRFRARLHNFNINSDDQIEEDETCEVCDMIGSKTTKLNVKRDEHDSLSPLDESSKFFRSLESLTLADNLIDVKYLDYKHLRTIFHWYFNDPLPPTTSMFPWLHGLHIDNFAQRKFFIQQQQQQLKVQSELQFNNIDLKPQARFLMTINSDIADNNEPILKNNTLINEILCPIDIAKDEVKTLLSSILTKIFGNNSLQDLIFEDIYKINYLPIFLNLDPDRGVSLRNFQIQVTKLSILSDFIIYCFDENDLDNCFRLARILWLAQKIESLESSSPLKYNIFIMKHFEEIEESEKFDDKIFSVSLKLKINKNYDINKIIKLNLNHLNNWDNEYTIKEKIETLKMSSSTKLTGNLFVGNSWDYQNFLNFKYSNLKNLINKKPLNFNNLYCNPLNSIVTAKFKLNDLIETILPLPNLNYKLFINCFNEASFPDDNNLQNFLKLFNKDDDIGDYYYLSFPSSGSIGFGDIKRENIISIINTLKLIYLISNVKNYDLLIYCSDGYTELSLLILCYIIYVNDYNIKDAIIDFHLKYGRPFYVFNTDVQVISKLEPILRKFSPKNKKTNWSEFENISNYEINEMLLTDQRLISTPSIQSSNSLLSNNFSANFNFSNKPEYFDGNLSSSDSESTNSSIDDTLMVEPDWVKEVEGSLPSRILPYLYLGSLKHANCLPLLSRLGITKIISVGEPLSWLHDEIFQKQNDIIIDELNDGAIELYNIQNRHNNQTYKVDQVMKVNNLQDDGIDQLESSLPTILQYIDDEYKKSNGQTKILVHCRVGVSRSATVVIAEVMRRLKINLPKAYLYVRVRRLNIIIQPNLKFMYEIFKWEELHKQHKEDYLREIDWFAMCREITLLNTPYLN